MDSLKQLDDSIGVGVDVGTVLNAEGMGSLDMSGLAPDGTTFEDVDDLSQIEHPDILLGGKMMEDAMASILLPQNPRDLSPLCESHQHSSFSLPESPRGYLRIYFMLSL